MHVLVSVHMPSLTSSRVSDAYSGRIRAVHRPVVCIMQMADLTSALAPFAGEAPAPAPIGDACAAGADDGCSDPEAAQKLRIAAVFIISGGIHAWDLAASHHW